MITCQPTGQARAGEGPGGVSEIQLNFLWQLGVGCSRFLVNEAHGVANEVVDVSQVHALARFIEPESTADWYPRARWRYLFVGTLDMLEMVSNNVHQFEFQRLLTPLLTEICAAGSAFVGRTIDGVDVV
jgi:hypothetical protein